MSRQLEALRVINSDQRPLSLREGVSGSAEMLKVSLESTHTLSSTRCCFLIKEWTGKDRQDTEKKNNRL